MSHCASGSAEPAGMTMRSRATAGSFSMTSPSSSVGTPALPLPAWRPSRAPVSPEPTETAEMAFCVHDVSVRVICEPAAVAEALARRLRAFRVDAVTPDAVLVTVTGPAAAPVISEETLDAARVVYEGPDGDLRYHDVGDRVVADYAHRVQLDVRARAGSAHLAVTGRTPADLMLTAYPLFTVSLLEVLKRRGRFALHAACLARDGRGLLLAGTSGSGKSTLAAALARDGYDFLGDDTVFL